MPNEMSALVVRILSVPVGSADAERAFSTFFHIRDKRRSTLRGDHLEDYMTIRLNGPNDLAAFPSLKYAQSWVAKNRLLTDSLTQADPKRGLPIEEIGLQNIKQEPRNAQGQTVGSEEKIYMDGSKYF